jgi:AraC family transcriptional activator of pobA
MKPRASIQEYKFKPGLPMELEIISIKDLYSKNKTQLTIPHRADFYHIIWVEKGNTTHLVDFNPVKVNSSAILFINKSRVHLFDHAAKFDGKLILFTDRFFCKNQDDMDFLNGSILFNDLLETTALKVENSSEDLAALLKLMEKEFETIPDHAILQNYLHNFLLLCDRAKRKQGFKEIPKGPDRDYTLLFVSLVNEQFSKARSVKTYADLIHISEKRLGRATATVLGKTPKQVINNRLVLEIKRLLVHTNQSIKEIGFSLGFTEPTNFIKYFRQHAGATPSEFRESHLR